MNLIYDISVLGAGHYNNRARTGIFRVVENLAYGLIKYNELNVSFSVISNQLEECYGYLQSNSILGKVPLTYNPKYISLFRTITNLQSTVCKDRYLNRSITKLRLLLTKKYLRYLKRYTNLTNGLTGISEADIFHSPFLPLPKAITNNRKPKRFITIYDLIPLLHPHYFEFKEDHLIRNVVESIDKDTWVISISESTKNDLCAYTQKVDPDKVIVTPLAASELFYHCNDTVEITRVKDKYTIPDQPYILSCCTLEPRKNIDHAIRCFVTLIRQEHIEDLCLVLVGSKGWDYGRIFDAMDKSDKLRDRIIITGYVADEDLAALYSGALAFIYPSFYEGFGLPPLEAMKCGIPVITSNTSSLPEVVGDAGIMVDPTDADALCQSMLDLYTKPSLRLELSEKVKKRANLFSWERCVNQTIDAYKRSLA